MRGKGERDHAEHSVTDAFKNGWLSTRAVIITLLTLLATKKINKIKIKKNNTVSILAMNYKRNRRKNRQLDSVKCVARTRHIVDSPSGNHPILTPQPAGHSATRIKATRAHAARRRALVAQAQRRGPTLFIYPYNS
jgi:hypothetical protein